MATDLTLYLDDRPGELARVGDVLGEAGANISSPACAHQFLAEVRQRFTSW